MSNHLNPLFISTNTTYARLAPRRRVRTVQLWRSNIVAQWFYALMFRLPFRWELPLQAVQSTVMYLILDLPLCSLFAEQPIANGCLSRLAAAAPHFVHRDGATGLMPDDTGCTLNEAQSCSGHSVISNGAFQSAFSWISEAFTFLPSGAQPITDCGGVSGCWSNIVMVQTVAFCCCLVLAYFLERRSRIKYLQSIIWEQFYLVEFRGIHVYLVLQCAWSIFTVSHFLLFSPAV